MNQKSPQPAEGSMNLHRTTRVILILGIIIMSAGLIYVLVRPEQDPDVIFILLNENQEMRDYPTYVLVNGTISGYIYVKNDLGHAQEFSLHIYRGINLTLDSQIGVSSDPSAVLDAEYPKTLADGENWTTSRLSFTFTTLGSNQLVIFELWQNLENAWQFMPDYILYLRIEVF